MTPDEILMRYMDVQCPWCGASKGTWCTSTRRETFRQTLWPDVHSVRVIAYEDQLIGGNSQVVVKNHQRRVIRFED